MHFDFHPDLSNQGLQPVGGTSSTDFIGTIISLGFLNVQDDLILGGLLHVVLPLLGEKTQQE